LKHKKKQDRLAQAEWREQRGISRKARRIAKNGKAWIDGRITPLVGHRDIPVEVRERLPRPLTTNYPRKLLPPKLNRAAIY
jgi:ribosomal protein L32E